VHDVQVALWRDGAGLHAEITDEGRPFDPLSHVLPEPPRDLQSAPIGGLGIKLMRSFAERIAYQRVGPMNRLTLSFPIPKLMPKEIGGPKGPEPTRYGDWEVNGRCTDF
jgi:anti-sigma regulatory factor (Ser/Thr protein kinase)